MCTYPILLYTAQVHWKLSICNTDTPIYQQRIHCVVQQMFDRRKIRKYTERTIRVWLRTGTLLPSRQTKKEKTSAFIKLLQLMLAQAWHVCTWNTGAPIVPSWSWALQSTWIPKGVKIKHSINRTKLPGVVFVLFPLYLALLPALITPRFRPVDFPSRLLASRERGIVLEFSSWKHSGCGIESIFLLFCWNTFIIVRFSLYLLKHPTFMSWFVNLISI